MALCALFSSRIPPSAPFLLNDEGKNNQGGFVSSATHVICFLMVAAEILFVKLQEEKLKEKRG